MPEDDPVYKHYAHNRTFNVSIGSNDPKRLPTPRLGPGATAIQSVPGGQALNPLQKIGYADDWDIVTQDEKFEPMEDVL